MVVFVAAASDSIIGGLPIFSLVVILVDWRGVWSCFYSKSQSNHSISWALEACLSGGDDDMCVTSYIALVPQPAIYIGITYLPIHTTTREKVCT